MGDLVTTIDNGFTRSKGLLPGYSTALIHISRNTMRYQRQLFDADVMRFSDLFALARLPLHVLAHI